MSIGLDTVIRNRVADFLEVPLNTDGDFDTTGDPTFVLMGSGFLSLDENPQAQSESRAYISDASATSIIRGYEVTFPFTADLIASESAVMALYNVGRNQLQGANAEFNYVRAELFKAPVSANTYPARLFRVSAMIDSIEGAGTEIMEMSGALNGVGDFVDGNFNIITREFTATDATP